MKDQLDNPIWTALNSVDANKNMGTTVCAYTDTTIAPFLALPFWDEQHQSLLIQYAPNRTWFLLIAEEVNFNPAFELVSSIPLYQFVCTKLIVEKKTANHDSSASQHKNPDDEIIQLNTSHVAEMLTLTQLTKPGPFRERTIEFGNYHGIFKDGKLVAMGGERLHTNHFSEVSAICTHPDYQGKGYAAKITAYLTESVLNNGKIPFLHARHDNEKAIALYNRLGYEFRTVINFYIIKKK